jgi:transcriptional regulator with XRE-family HTH domain
VVAHKLKIDPEQRVRVGSRLKRARENLKLTPAEAARALGVAEVSARYWETGRSVSSVELLTARQRLYRVSFQALLVRTSEEELQRTFSGDSYEDWASSSAGPSPISCWR